MQSLCCSAVAGRYCDEGCGQRDSRAAYTRVYVCAASSSAWWLRQSSVRIQFSVPASWNLAPSLQICSVGLNHCHQSDCVCGVRLNDRIDWFVSLSVSLPFFVLFFVFYFLEQVIDRRGQLTFITQGVTNWRKCSIDIHLLTTRVRLTLFTNVWMFAVWVHTIYIYLFPSVCLYSRIGIV